MAFKLRMSAGRLRHQMTLQSQQGGVDELNQERRSVWSDRLYLSGPLVGQPVTYRVCLQPITGVQQYFGEHFQGKFSDILTIRGIQSVMPTVDDRLSWRDLNGTMHFFYINLPRDYEGRGKWLDLLCVEKFV